MIRYQPFQWCVNGGRGKAANRANVRFQCMLGTKWESITGAVLGAVCNGLVHSKILDNSNSVKHPSCKVSSAKT